MDPALKERLSLALAASPGATAHARGRGPARRLVAASVRRLVFDGHLRRGDPLPVDELAELLRVGITPAREGILLLEANGWLDVSRGHVPIVNGLDRAFVEDHMTVMGSIWALLLRRIDDAASKADLHPLAISVGEAPDAATLAGANRAFVEALIAAADTPRVAAMLRSTAPLVPGNLFAVVPGAMALQKRSAPAVGQALQRSATARACTIAVEHHRALARLIVDLLDERGVLDDRRRR